MAADIGRYQSSRLDCMAMTHRNRTSALWVSAIIECMPVTRPWFEQRRSAPGDRAPRRRVLDLDTVLTSIVTDATVGADSGDMLLRIANGVRPAVANFRRDARVRARVREDVVC
jgi:hypothetical protein